MSPSRRSLSLAAVAASLLACSSADMMRRFTPADADARARGYIAQLQRQQLDSAASRFVAPLATPEAREQLAGVASILGNRAFDSTAVVGANVNTFNGVRHTNLTYEFHSPSGWVLASVAMVDTAGTWLVEGFSARPLARSLEEDSAFTLAGKSPRHYLWLVLTALSAALTFGTAIFLATRRAMPKRWRWVLLSLVGVGSFTLNWTTGAIGVQLLNVQLFGAGFVRLGSAMPWIITFAIPVGALIGIDHYRRWRARRAVAGDDEAVPARAVELM